MFFREEVRKKPIASAYIEPQDLDKIRRRLSREDCALVDILRLSGYRVDDLLCSVEFQWSGKTSVTLKEAKTGNIRTVKITPELREAIDRYKSVRRLKWKPTMLTYFVQARRFRKDDAHKRHRTTLYRHFAEAVKKAGLEGKGYTVHSLRKCYAVNLYASTGSLLAVQKDLGHSNIATTCLYVFASRASL